MSGADSGGNAGPPVEDLTGPLPAIVPGSRPLIDVERSDTELLDEVVRLLDRALGSPPRRRLGAGAVLLAEDETVEGLQIILEGEVQLARKGPRGEVLLHRTSSGRIIGLMAATRYPRSFFTCRAATEVTVLPVAFADLQLALQREPALQGTLVSLAMRTAVRRHRASVRLQLEVDALATDLAAERDRLAETLDALEHAHLRLVESARMATLGELAAGLAHELNNPVAAILRSTAHLAEDVEMLLGAAGADTTRLAEAVHAGLTLPARSTAEDRRIRGELAAAVGNRRLAERLRAAGIETAAAATAFLHSAGAAGDQALEQLARAHHLGVALRNTTASAQRVAELVGSLRGYARPDTGPVPGVDVREGIEDTLRLFGHRLGDVEVVRRYADVPPITARPGELNQAWTNLVANALDAMEDRGRLELDVANGDSGTVTVKVTDSGPGIPAERMPELFTRRFTTKGGRVRFGLGLGLAITHHVVQRHGGTISVESEPGRTVFTVTLPVDGIKE